MQQNNLAIIHSNSAKDSKPQWYHKDRWLYDNLGISGEKSDRYVTFSFEKIKQAWLKEIIKKYIFYWSINKSCYSVDGSLSSLRLFSNYLDQLDVQGPSSLDGITRDCVIGYLSYLAQKNISVVTKKMRISSLSMFFNTCYERGWMSYSGRLIYLDDIPKLPKSIPRFIPERVLQQLNDKLKKMDPHIRRLIMVLQETGMRINEAIILEFNCTYQDKDNDYFLRYFQSKLCKDHVIPISLELADEIREQQQVICKEWGTHALLFPIPIKVKPVNFERAFYSTKKPGQPWTRRRLSDYINDFSEYHKIKDESGHIYRFQFHQFRHTCATRMINNDVPQHIVQRFLGHESPGMTERYAYMMDETLKKAFIEFRRKIVTISGEVVTPKEVSMNLAERTSPEEIDARWLKKNIMAQTLPNGICALPVVSNSCPHSNACLTCVNFRTDHRHLLTHKQQLEKTKAIILQAKQNGWQRQVDMNAKIQANLENIIIALEDEKDDA